VTNPMKDETYLQARADRELALARSAPHPEAARAHAILARLYLDRLGAAKPGDESSRP
jgi:hypothetical protein